MKTNAHKPPVTVIIPCFNEEEGVRPLLKRLESLRNTSEAKDWHFLFVDDGSTDGTFAELLRAERDRPWIEVVRHHENLGLGAAIRTGFAHARSDVVCTIDSDCTYPPERLPELTALVDEGAAIVTASAWHPDSSAAQGGPIRLALSRAVSAVYKTLIGRDVYTFTCLFRAYRRDVVERTRFRANGFSAVAEFLLRALLAGDSVAEVPMLLESRRYGESKLRISNAIMSHLHLITLTAMAVGMRYLRQAFLR